MADAKNPSLVRMGGFGARAVSRFRIAKKGEIDGQMFAGAVRWVMLLVGMDRRGRRTCKVVGGTIGWGTL